jgi:RNA polymerase sigma factor for flagellar operon FliA
VERDRRVEQLKKYEPLIRSLVRRHVRIAQTFCGPVLDEDDLLVEARMAVIDALAAFEPRGVSEFAWVKTRIRQRLLDAIRRFNVRSRHEIDSAKLELDTIKADLATRRRVVSLDEMFDDTGTIRIPGSLAPPDADITHTSTVALVYQALATLPDRQRRALEMGYLQGRPLSEIARTMGVTESRVSQLQKQAIANLRAILVNVEN